MGIIRATLSAIGGGLADTWAEVLEADNMSDTTVFTRGVTVRKNDPAAITIKRHRRHHFQRFHHPCL